MAKVYRLSSMRLPEWDYTAPGAYFITICTHQRECLFYNDNFRRAAEGLWRAIPTRPHARHHVCLDESVLMPDHFHGIFHFTDYPPKLDQKRRDPNRLQPGSVGSIVGTFKLIVAKRINLVRGTVGERVWQRGYYDRLIRDEKELQIIRQYIRDNPERWRKNQDNLDAHLAQMRWVSWVE